MKPGRLLEIKGLGDVGYVPDVASFELAPNALADVSNFRTLNGWAERVHGHRQVFDTTSTTPYFIATLATQANRYVVHCTSNQVYADDGGRTNITGTLSPQPVILQKWTSAVLSGNLILNNGTDNPFYWGGATGTPCATLPGWTSTNSCKAIAAIKYHLVALNVTKAGVAYPHRVMWSSAAVPGSVPSSWNTADPTVDSREEDVVGDGVLVGSAPLGESLVLYKERSMSLMTWVGGQSVFSIRPLPDPIGMVAPNCVAVVPGIGHVVLTQGDVVKHAGVGATSILDQRAKQWLRSNIDPDSYAQSFVVANYQKSEVWICFPEKGYSFCTKALVWNWITNTISKRDLPNVTFGCAGVFNYAVDNFDAHTETFDSSTATFNSITTETFGTGDTRLLMCGTANKLYAMDSTDLADGASFTGYFELNGLHLDMPERRKHLRKVWPRIDAAVGAQVSIYFGASSDPETAPTYSAPVTYTVGTNQWADGWAEGRYLALKLSSTSWFRVRSMQLDVIAGGAF